MRRTGFEKKDSLRVPTDDSRRASLSPFSENQNSEHQREPKKDGPRALTILINCSESIKKRPLSRQISLEGHSFGRVVSKRERENSKLHKYAKSAVQ